MSLTHTQVHAGDQGTDPRRLSSALTEVVDKGIQEDAEGETDAVDDDVGEEGRHDHYPTPPAIWWQRWCNWVITDVASFWSPHSLIRRLTSGWRFCSHFV